MQYFRIEVSLKTRFLPNLVDLERDIQVFLVIFYIHVLNFLSLVLTLPENKILEDVSRLFLEFKVGPSTQPNLG